MSRTTTFLRHHRRLLISLAVLVLLLIFLIPQADTLWRSLGILRHASPGLVLLAIFMTVMTYVLSGEIYHLLLKHPVPLRLIMLVQAATALTSRVAPIGVGTMGLNAYFLRKHRHSLSEALAVVAANNGLGVIGHLCLLAFAVLGAAPPDNFHFHLGWRMLFWVFLALAITGIALLFSQKLRRSIQRGIGDLLRAIASYRHQPGRLALALAASVILSCVYALALVASTQALGVDVSVGKIFLIYTFSLLTGAVTPTPGGLVGVEAGLVAGFVAYGVSADTGLAIALLYRLITEWLPILPGLIAFRVMQQKYL
jgi:glycosyltransferase 2 family protein